MGDRPARRIAQQGMECGAVPRAVDSPPMKPNPSDSRSALAAATERDPRWPAVLARSAEADGSFYYSVRTTGVYCRPSCSARRPRPENVRFHETREDAERAGFRPCKRCRPGGPAPSARLAARGGAARWGATGSRRPGAASRGPPHASPGGGCMRISSLGHEAESPPRSTSKEP